MKPNEFRAMAPGALKYQYEQIIKHLLLLQDHAAAQACPYSPAGEMCIRKHLMTLEAYAEETIPMEDDSSFKAKLQNLDAEATNHRLDQEAALCGQQACAPDSLEHWARKWRKEFETHSLTCELEKSLQQAPQRSAAAAAVPEPV